MRNLTPVGAVAMSLWLGGVTPVTAAEATHDDGAAIRGRTRIEADSALADLQRQIEKLEKRFDTLAAESRARLERKRRVLRRKLGELRTRTERAWRTLRPELERTFDALRKALEDPDSVPEVTPT